MSKINSGILGPYSGTIGSVTGYRHLGKNIIKSKRQFTAPVIVNNLISNNQRATQLNNLMNIYKAQILRAYIMAEIPYKLDWNHHWLTCGQFLDLNEPYFLKGMIVPTNIEFDLMHYESSLIKATKRLTIRGTHWQMQALKNNYNYLAGAQTFAPGGLFQLSSNNFSYTPPSTNVSYNTYTIDKPKAVGFLAKKITAPKNQIFFFSVYGE